MDSVKKRNFPDKNYSAIWHDYKTLRIPHDPSKPILELDYPEFYDVKVTNHCTGGCQYCYQDSNSKDFHYDEVIEKIDAFFGVLDSNQKPFQVAIGGGNPNEHPEFTRVIRKFHQLGIVPNYTTNGVGITTDILEATKRYCGGVAITCHKHLAHEWEISALRMILHGIKLNFHVLIGSNEDIDDFVNLYEKWSDDIDYFVLLPLTEVGRAKDVVYDKAEVAKRLISVVEGLGTNQVAFGANYYPYLKNSGTKLDISLYEPEILSKYLDLKDMKVYKSSFNLEEVRSHISAIEVEPVVEP